MKLLAPLSPKFLHSNDQGSRGLDGLVDTPDPNGTSPKVEPKAEPKALAVPNTEDIARRTSIQIEELRGQVTKTRGNS